jgi:hypothetical protein
MLLQAVRRSGEAVTHAVLAAVGLAAAAGGAAYGVLAEGGRVGPGFLPLAAGLLTAGLSGACAVLAARRTTLGLDGDEAGGDAGPDPDDEKGVDITGRTEPQRVRNVWVVFGLTLGALVLVQLLGFLVAFGLLVVVIGAVVEKQSLGRSVVIAVVAVGVVYAVFGLFLSVPLPGGLLGLGTEW